MENREENLAVMQECADQVLETLAYLAPDLRAMGKDEAIHFVLGLGLDLQEKINDGEAPPQAMGAVMAYDACAEALREDNALPESLTIALGRGDPSDPLYRVARLES